MVVGGGGGGRGGKVNLAYRVMGGFITAGEGKWLKCDREMDGCIIRGVGGGWQSDREGHEWMHYQWG